MKIAALIYLLIFSILNMQLMLDSSQKVFNTGGCCEKTKCSEQKPQPENDTDCKKNQCNPFMSCVNGNFYLINKYNFSLACIIEERLKAESKNDNRLLTSTSDCWHPPEYYSPYIA